MLRVDAKHALLVVGITRLQSTGRAKLPMFHRRIQRVPLSVAKTNDRSATLKSVTGNCLHHRTNL